MPFLGIVHFKMYKQETWNERGGTDLRRTRELNNSTVKGPKGKEKKAAIILKTHLNAIVPVKITERVTTAGEKFKTKYQS